MLDARVELSMADLLHVPADVLVIEDSGWLTASRGVAAMIDGLHSELPKQRAQALQQHGGPFDPGMAVPLRADAKTDRRSFVWAVTFSYASGSQHAADRIRATPLDVAAASRGAITEAAQLGAGHVVMHALGTRLEHHALPPTPKKLPRYVMAAAQLIGVQQALADQPAISRVTICLTQRDYGIFSEVLGRTVDHVGEGALQDD